MTRSRVVSAEREGGLWSVDVEDSATGAVNTFQARMLINAAGPWVDVVLSNAVRKNRSTMSAWFRAAISS